MSNYLLILLLLAVIVMVPYVFALVAWRTLRVLFQRLSEKVESSAKRRNLRCTGPMATKTATQDVITAAMLGFALPETLTYAAYDEPSFTRRPAMCVLRSA